MNEENQGNEMSEIEKSERQVKQAGKDAARKTGKILGDLTKKGIKALIRAIGIKGLLILSAFFLIPLLAGLLWLGVGDSVREAISDIAKSVTVDESGNITKITEIDGRKFKINSEELEQKVNKWFKDNNVSKNLIGLSDDLSGLTEFLEAEVVTNYPDLRKRDKIGTEVPKGEIQGCVQFHRRMLDGTTIVLEYMPYTDFTTELAKVGITLDSNQTQQQIYYKKDEVEALYNKLKDKFTLDENDNLLVVNKVTTEKQVIYSEYAKAEGNVDSSEYIYDIEVTNVNYQNVIQKYTMPFEFCLSLLITSENYEFAKAVSDLAKESKIIVDIQDNITTNVTTEVYSFDVEFNIQRYIKYYTITQVQNGNEVSNVVSSTTEYNPYPIEKTAKMEINPYKTTISTLQNNNIRLCVRQAKTWIADYNSEYTNVITHPSVADKVSYEPDDGEFKQVADCHGLVETVDYSLPSGGHIVEDRGVVSQKKTNKKTVTSAKITVNEYNKSSSDVETTPEKFLSLLKVDPDTGVFDVENLTNNSKLIEYENIEKKEKSSPVNNLLSGRDVLYQFLASNSKTVHLEDTMRHLINVYRGVEKAKEAEDFELYEPDEFIFIDGAWRALWQNNYTKQQFIQMVEAYEPPNGTGNKNRSYREFYQKHFVANAENYFDIATSYGLDPMFIFCIGIHESAYGTSNISYDKGNFWGWGAYDSSPYESAQSFVGDASKGIETVCKGLANNYVSPSGRYYGAIQAKGYDPTTIEGVGSIYASDSSWASKIKSHMTTIFGVSGQIAGGEIILTGDAQNKIVQWAEIQVGKSSFYNRARGGNYLSKNYCAAFVKSAYNEAGLGYINGNAIDIPHSNPIKYIAAGKVDYSNIPIGACIVSKGSGIYGHVALYVGNGYVIEAGGRTIVKQKIDESYGVKYGFLGWGYATTSQTI